MNFTIMKKVLNILLFFPIIGFGQGLLDCALLSVTDVVIQNDSIVFEVFNADTMDSHYPYISATLDGNGDTIQTGQMDWYVTPGEAASYYYYTNFSGNYVDESVNQSNVVYPLSVYFTYSNLIGENPGDYSCELTYNPQMTIVNPAVVTQKTLLKTIDILGRSSKDKSNQLLIDLYKDGTTRKRIVLD